MPCPNCHRADLALYLDRDAVAAETALRPRFYGERIEGKLADEEKVDRFIVSHGAGAELRICPACRILVRVEEASPDFEDEPYADYQMERMLRAHVEAFRQKASHYRHLLPQGARVVEVGSYVGGFLHVGGEWGWEVTGIDVGRDTSHFTRAHGYRTRAGTLEECGFAGAELDGVFIWNCFEQLEPEPLLAEAARIVRPGGVLLLRVPNARFYEHFRGDPIALGHANLLGFPHLYGYSAESLDAVVRRYGFERHQLIGARHIQPTRGRLTLLAIHEEEALEQQLAQLGPELAPWLEAVYFRSTVTTSDATFD